MADALVRLAEEEHKSAADLAALLELVEKLNEAVPTLSLAYDAQTDSLNLTAEAIRALTEAEYARQEQEAAAERLSGAYQEQITIAEELLAAEDALQAARERYAAFEGTEARNAKESVSMEAAKGQLIAAQGAYDRLTKAQQENEAEIAALEKAYGKYSGAADQAADATGGVGSAARQTADRLTALTTVLGAVQGGYELLAQAQEQQSETGYLELDTVTRLLEEYPNLAGYLEEAAGGYRLAEGALQDYMATQRAEYALAVNEARTAALELIKNEQAKAEAIGLTNEALANQLRIQAEEYQAMGANADNRAEGDSYYAIANQYRDAANAIESASSALEEYDRISASLRREHGSSGSSSRRTSSTAKAETRSAGETAMEEFQAWLDDMDHQIFLWSKDESKVQAIADLYQAMMDRAHQVAQELRAQGYQDTSDEIQQLQELWWGWAEERESLTFRYACQADVPLIMRFIKELAAYEGLKDQVVATEADLDESLFQHRKAEVIFAVEDGLEVGFALFFQNYSTFLGRGGICLEDMYILPEYRGRGYGKALLRRLAKIALERRCGRLEWWCQHENRPGIAFYTALGAKAADEWALYRMGEEAMEDLAGSR